MSSIIKQIIISNPQIAKELKLTEEEIDFMLENAKAYLNIAVNRSDISSSFAGLRPLVTSKSNKKSTKEISRNHQVVKSASGLFSILGGKWTTFRRMGEDTIDQVNKTLQLSKLPSMSNKLMIENSKTYTDSPIHPELPYTWSQMEDICKEEMVETVEDLLARRTRCLILSKQATNDVLDKAIQLLQTVKSKDDIWRKNQKNTF
jgi:glycerol-3-phosphate dehydrogenase